MNEAEEVLGIVLPADKYPALPLDPGEEAFYQPPSSVSPESPMVLRCGFAAVCAVRCDHLDAVAAQLLIQWIAVVSAIADEVLRLGLDHVEVETELNQTHSWWLAARVLTESGKPWQSTMAMLSELQNCASAVPDVVSQRGFTSGFD